MTHVRVADPTTCHRCGRVLTRGDAVEQIDPRGRATCVDCATDRSRPPSPPSLPMRPPRLSRMWRRSEVVDLTQPVPDLSDAVPDTVAWGVDPAPVDGPHLAPAHDSAVVTDQPPVSSEAAVADEPDDGLTLPDPGGTLASGSDRRDRSLTAADLPPVVAGRAAGSLAARPRRRRHLPPEPPAV